MAAQLYRLIVSTMGLETSGDKTTPVVIPIGATLKYLSDEGGVANFMYEGNVVQVLISDLRERGKVLAN